MSLESRVAALETTVGGLGDTYLTAKTADAFYLMVVGTFVFFMQAGFALLEAGSVRAKNAKNILMKNLLDACIGTLVWWLWGYGLAYDGGDNGFIGLGGQGAWGPSYAANGYNTADEGAGYAGWWFQFVFCAAAATIVSGAMAERTSIVGYLVYTIVISGFIYPVVVKWTWGGGFVATWNNGLLDFAGSGIVHMTGGVAALVGAKIVGPRKGRIEPDGKINTEEFKAHNATFQVLGTFILWFGWYGFNPGSTLAIAGQGLTMARCIMTTTISGAVGGLTALLAAYFKSKTLDVGELCNGILAGLVSICAGTGNVYPWAALLIGFIGGLVYFMAAWMVLNICKIDDPLNAFAVHGAAGMWGLIGAAFLAPPEFGVTGAFYGDGAAFGSAIIFILTNLSWTGGVSVLMFLPLNLMGVLRISSDQEDQGMDVSKHGGSAYSYSKDTATKDMPSSM